MQPTSLLTRIVSLSPRTLRLLPSSFNAALHTSRLTLSLTTAEPAQHTTVSTVSSRQLIPTSGVSVTRDGGDPAALSELTARLNLSFSDPSILIQTFTHKSYQHGQLPTNERLEMLGRRVLELHVTDIVDRTQPNGDLKDLTWPYLNHDRLARLGRNIGLQKVTRYTLPAKSSDTGVNRIIATGFRALIGAIYHDKGAIAANEFIDAHVLSPLNAVEGKNVHTALD